MRIQHNIMAMNAYRNYNTNTSALAKNLEKLSSGYKINRAGDDAAGLAISEKMRAQITGLNAAQKNVKDGISLVKTAEGAMQEIQDMLNRMDYLATQSANGTYDNEVDRANLQKEVDQLKSEINRIADSANFNGIKLLDGSLDANRASAGASAISEITTNEYSAQGASPAFKTTFIQDRPGAAISQTNAAFSVNLDDVALQGFTAGDTITLNVGDAQITYTVTGTDSISTAADIVDKLITAGKAVNTASAGESANYLFSLHRREDGHRFLGRRYLHQRWRLCEDRRALLQDGRRRRQHQLHPGGLHGQRRQDRGSQLHGWTEGQRQLPCQ